MAFKLYPMKFNPIFKQKLWGGHKISTILGKDFGDLINCGEVWELSGVRGNVSIVANGYLEGVSLLELMRTEGRSMVGGKNYLDFGDEFPLLVKFIDAHQDLSIQVHPDDQLANKRHGCKGKTEMWYIIHADEGSSLIVGFNKAINRNEYLEKFNTGQLETILNKEFVSNGDLFFIPAGRVHTIGKGLLIAEIQQTSDVTYRIYDFDRTDDNGNKRQLHIEEALDAIDYNVYNEYRTPYPDKQDKRNSLVNSEFFKTNKLKLTTTFDADLSQLDSFRIYTCTEGSARITTERGSLSISKGEVGLIPADNRLASIEPNRYVELLETYIESQ